MFDRNPPADERKSRAYLVYSEWGPDRRIPRDERLAACFPDATAAERASWAEEFNAVDREIWKLAEAAIPRTSGYHEFRKRLSRAFPFLNEDALKRSWALATYYTVHEGY